MKFNHDYLSRAGFTLLEAVVATALISVAMVSAFSITKILSSGKSALDDRTNFYIASESINANYALMLSNLTSTDMQNFTVSYLTSTTCASNANATMQDRVQTILCSTLIPYDPRYAPTKKAYTIALNNAVTLNGTTNLIQVKLIFKDAASNNILFERFFQYVK